MLQIGDRRAVALLKSSIGGGGGLEKQTLRLVQELCRSGYQVSLLTSGWQSTGEELPFTVINVAPRYKLSVQNLIAFDHACQSWLKQHPHDIVFGLDRNSYQTHYRAGNGIHATYIKQRRLVDGWWRRASFRLNPLHLTTLRFERRCMRCPNLQRLFANSEMVAKEAERTYGVDRSKICVVHNGVEWREMKVPFTNWVQEKEQSCDQLGLDSSAHQFLFVGQDYKRKGLSFLLRGLAKLREYEWQLSVVGPDRRQSQFVSLAKDLGVQQQVFFFGRRETTPFYQLADTLCIPSIYDPFANVTVEALAMGVPVITSQYNGGKEVLNHSSGCVIEDLGNPDAVAEALQWALQRRKNPTRASSIRETARHLDFESQLAKIVKNL